MDRHDVLAEIISNRYGHWEQADDGEEYFVSQTALGSFSPQVQWYIVSTEVDLSSEPEVSQGLDVGWLLWTVKRLDDLGANNENDLKAAYLFKKLWEQNHPGQTKDFEDVRTALKDYQSVAHLWTASLLSGDNCMDAF